MSNDQDHFGRPPLGGFLLLDAIAENWWLFLLRGIAAILFGILAFVWPGLTLLTLVLLWGIYALVDGVFALWSAISGRTGGLAPRWWLAAVGVVGVIAGLGAFAWPAITALVLLAFIAAWAIITGLVQIWGAIRLRKEIEGEWLLGLMGLLSIIFGVALIAMPEAGLVVLVWMIGWFALLTGFIHIFFAFRVRRHRISA